MLSKTPFTVESLASQDDHEVSRSMVADVQLEVSRMREIIQICLGLQVIIRLTTISVSVTKRPLALWLNFNITCEEEYRQ